MRRASRAGILAAAVLATGCPAEIDPKDIEQAGRGVLDEESGDQVLVWLR